MVKILFADLSKTIDITHGEIDDDMSLQDILDSFAKVWSFEEITISGAPIAYSDLKKSASELVPGAWKNSILQIEKHR